MPPSPINIREKLGQFTDQWAPKIIAEMDGFAFKLARLEGDFVWHSHPDTDETFIVIEGTLRIDFRDGQTTVGQGEMIVVPMGVEHKPFAASECQVMIIERDGTVNTGDAPASDRTADSDARI